MGSSKLELYKFVNGLHEYFNIDYDSFPIQTVELCKRVDTKIQYHPFKTDGFCAAILLGSKVDTIILNSKRHPIEQNFDCGHEVIHKTKHRNLGIDTFSCMELRTSHQGGYWEWEANEGSAEFLVPYYSLLPEIKKAHPFLKTWYDFHRFKIDMAEKYGVSDAVINFRFESLKYEIRQFLDGTPLDRINILSNKQQEARGIKVKSFNDIESEKYISDFHIHRLDLSNLDV